MSPGTLQSLPHFFSCIQSQSNEPHKLGSPPSPRVGRVPLKRWPPSAQPRSGVRASSPGSQSPLQLSDAPRSWRRLPLLAVFCTLQIGDPFRALCTVFSLSIPPSPWSQAVSELTRQPGQNSHDDRLTASWREIRHHCFADSSLPDPHRRPLETSGLRKSVVLLS